MYCQKCGSENLENAAMCQSCGGVFVYSKPARTSGMALTSMILSISSFPLLGVFGIVWIIGLVFGIIALNRINRSGGQLRGKSFAITGIAVSAAGLAVLLTCVGVLLFFTSAKTISLSKKLKMHTAAATPANIGQKPSIKGWVCIQNDKTNSIDNCTETLFTPGQFEANDLTITMGMTCGPEGQKPVEASWQFADKKDKADTYNFTITVPMGQSTLTTNKTIIYEGKEQKVFEDKQIKIYIKPEK
jgi:Domain of unknown function (DUF4190)